MPNESPREKKRHPFRAAPSASAVDPEVDDPLYDSIGAGKFLGVSPKTIEKDRCVPSMKIPFIRVGRCVRYRKSDLMAYIARNRVDPSAPAAVSA